MKFFALIALIATVTAIRTTAPDARPVVTPGESVVEPDVANLKNPGEGPDPAYNRITGGPRYA